MQLLSLIFISIILFLYYIGIAHVHLILALIFTVHQIFISSYVLIHQMTQLIKQKYIIL